MRLILTVRQKGALQAFFQETLTLALLLENTWPESWPSPNLESS